MSSTRIHSMPSGQEHWSLTKGSNCPVCGAMNISPCRNSIQKGDTLPKHTVHASRLNSVGSPVHRTDIMPKFNPKNKGLTAEQLKALQA